MIPEIKVGLKFRPGNLPFLGKITAIDGEKVTVSWYDENKHCHEPETVLKLKHVLDNFRLYGWRVLSGLEEELI